uniref:Uncharacterized protein n=1 Tax=Nitzschia sp. PL1-4 TaxID=2083272 RepID=A0A2Z5ZB09_9STRA|nr:hypothetical protein Ycf89 [Nitzschia sp. PL1-4]BBC77556.1 hypothetical protein Ycf89 [Nitzschia sp. PL1-4]
MLILGIISFIYRIFRIFSYFLGYPYNKGIPFLIKTSDFFIPEHKTFWPTVQPTSNWFEVFITPWPQMNLIEKYKYKSFYLSFFIFEYKNINFLPNILSEFFQISLDNFNETDFLKSLRETLFVGSMTYTHMLNIRVTSSWFTKFNPFDFPWRYFCLLIDPFEDFMTSYLPAEFFQVSIELPFLLFVFGLIGDQINHIVYTMPYLPSEAKSSGIIVRRKLRKILIFQGLPLLWCKFAIPTLLKEFWSSRHPHILDYLNILMGDMSYTMLSDQLE